MAFILPTFNLTCDVYTSPYNYSAPPRIAALPCQLRAPNTGAPVYTNGLFQITHAVMLLVPKGTDLRDAYSAPANSSDAIVLPPGTTCRYQVLYVNDVGRGFPNEHRYAILAKVATGPWPVPYPPG